jgi:Protein of unknown function (DUF2523)
MKIGTWLLSLVQPLLGRILTALGFSVVSIVGVEASVAAVRTLLIDNVNALPADLLQVFLLAGGGKAVGIILGAIATKLMLWQIQNATKILGTNPT